VTSANRRRHHKESDYEDTSMAAELVADARTCLVLTFLLGMTWSVGYLIRGQMARYAAFAFVVANGCVGIFTFLHTVVLNQSLFGELMVRLGFNKGQYMFTPGGAGSRVRRVAKLDREATLKSQTKKKPVKVQAGQEYTDEVAHRSASLTSSDSTSLDSTSTPPDLGASITTVTMAPIVHNYQIIKRPVRRLASAPAKVEDRRHSHW
jgi:hypothetical protein